MGKEMLVFVYMYGGFVLLYLTNIFLGVVQGVLLAGGRFEPARVRRSLIRLSSAALATVLLACVYRLLVCALCLGGIALEGAVRYTLSCALFTLMYARAFYAYFSDVCRKLRSLLLSGE